MKREFVCLLMSTLVVLSAVLPACAPTAPVAPTVPTTPTMPTAPTTPTTPTKPATPTVESPRYGGKFTHAPLAGFRAGFDTHATNQSTILVSGPVLQNLLEGDWAKGAAGTGEADWLTATPILKLMKPNLAESWELPDDQTIIFHIRKGVRWALNPALEASRLVGGRELTADDVAFALNWRYQLNPEAPDGFNTTATLPEERPISVTATDKYTVVIKGRKETQGILFNRVAASHYIFSPEVIKKYRNQKEWYTLVGTGPFMVSDYVDGSSLSYIRNPNYWEKDPIGPGKGNQLPYVDNLVLLQIVDVSTRLAAFRTGKIDNLGGRGNDLSGEQVKLLEMTVPNLQKVAYPGAGGTINFRLDKPEQPWYDIRVRQAMNLAIDRQTIVKEYYKGDALLTTVPSTPYPVWVKMGGQRPFDKWPKEFQELYVYNPEKAKQLLAAAGYPNGFKAGVIVDSNEKKINELTIIKEYLAKIGINLDIQIKERGVFTSIDNARTHTEGFYAGISPSAYLWYTYRPEHNSNKWMLDDPVVTQAILDFGKYFFLDDDKAYQVMVEAFDYILKKALFIDFPTPYEYTVWWPWVKNYHGELMLGQTNQLGYARYVWIDQKLRKQMGF